MQKRSPKTDSGKWKFGISKLGIAALTAGLFAVFTFLGCPIEDYLFWGDEPVTVEYPASLEGTVWSGPTTAATGSPWATFVFHDKTGLEGTAVYYFSDHPTDIPPQQSTDPQYRAAVAYTYIVTSTSAGGNITRYTADGGGTYSFQLDPTSKIITITGFDTPAFPSVSIDFQLVASGLDEDHDLPPAVIEPNPWTPGALPADLDNTVWMGKAPNGGWLTITLRAPTAGTPPTAPITASFSVDNSTNDWTATYYGNTDTTGGKGGTMTGMGDFDIVTTGSAVSQDELVFINFFGHAKQRTFYRYR
jgi:hypothetical protein